MKFVTFATSVRDVEMVGAAADFTDVLLEPKEFSRLGRIDFATCTELAGAARSAGCRSVLVWDILMTEGQYQGVVETLAEYRLDAFDAIRVADIGAAFWVLNNTSCEVQLIVEAGSHNVPALQGWEQFFGERLTRFIVSHELPEPSLVHIASEISTPLEVLGAGRIELFYSPRPLLSKSFEFDEQERIEVNSASEKSHNRAFPTVETIHGTMMYLHRDRFVLNRHSKLHDCGVQYLRVDLRHISIAPDSCSEVVDIQAALTAGREYDWPRPCGTPFKHSNNTTRQFKRLKSKVAAQRGDCVAQVIATESDNFTVYRALRKGVLTGPFKFALPTGDQMQIDKLAFRSVKNDSVSACEADEVFVSPWVRKVGPGTLLFSGESD